MVSSHLSLRFSQPESSTQSELIRRNDSFRRLAQGQRIVVDPTPANQSSRKFSRRRILLLFVALPLLSPSFTNAALTDNMHRLGAGLTPDLTVSLPYLLYTKLSMPYRNALYWRFWSLLGHYPIAPAVIKTEVK